MSERLNTDQDSQSQSPEAVTADVLCAKTPIYDLMSPDSENYFAQTREVFEGYGRSIIECLEDINTSALQDPQLYHDPNARPESKLGIGADVLRDMATFAAAKSSPKGKVPRITPLDAHPSPTTVANLARNILHAYHDPQDLLSEFQKTFDEKRAVADKFNLEFEEPERIQRILGALLPVLYGDRYETHQQRLISTQEAADRERKRESAKAAQQARFAKLDEQGTLINDEQLASSVSLAHAQQLAQAATILGYLTAHGKNILSLPRHHYLSLRTKAAKRKWDRRQSKSDRAILFRKTRAKRAAKAKAAYDKKQAHHSSYAAAITGRFAKTQTVAQERAKALTNKRQQINEKVLTARMKKQAKAEERVIRQSQEYQHLTTDQRRSYLEALRQSEDFKKIVRAHALTALRREAVQNGIYVMRPLPAAA
ncbi:MAG: hypothetical protein KA604_02475 [Candidatus Saccharimonas sp.]|nr:hypothetical protein [Candidatus Saccharimonas sp.]